METQAVVRDLRRVIEEMGGLGGLIADVTYAFNLAQRRIEKLVKEVERCLRETENSQ